MHCTSYCKYDALNRSDIEKGIPGLTCTLCGDCLAGCSHNSIKYRFLRLSPEASRNLWIVITVSLHGVFLALGRI
jgi:ferredoxin